jgi:hypothetical protein
MAQKKQPAGTGSGVTFFASIPPMETAIKIHGDGGARMQLDIAESDLAGFLPALIMRGKRLSVTLVEAK